MSSISVSKQTKQDFDDLKPEDCTHDEFVEILLETYQKDVDGVVIDPDAIADEIKDSVATEVELAAHRGVQSGIEQYEPTE